MTPFYNHMLHALKDWPCYATQQEGRSKPRVYKEAFRLETDPLGAVRWRQWGERVAGASKAAERMTHSEWLLAREKAAARQEKRRKAREEKEKLLAMTPQIMLQKPTKPALSPFYRRLLSLDEWPRGTDEQGGYASSLLYSEAYRLKTDPPDLILWRQRDAHPVDANKIAERMTVSEWQLAKAEMKVREAKQRQKRKQQRKEAAERMLKKAASLTFVDARVYAQQASHVACTLEDAYFPYEREAVMKELRTVSTNKGTTTMNLIPFNVEKAKEGAQVVTRTGLPARVLCYDFKGDELSVVAAIMEDDSGETLIRFTPEGLAYTSGETCNLDLFLVPKTKKVWLWVYIDKQRRSAVTFDTKESMLEWQAMCAQYAIPLLEQEIEILDI